MILLGTCLLYGSRTYGEETKDYESKSSTGFYGVYNYPKEIEEVPLPDTGGKTIATGPGRTELLTQDGKVITLLPQTGDHSYWLIGSSGLLMIGLAAYLGYKKQHESRILK